MIKAMLTTGIMFSTIEFGLRYDEGQCMHYYKIGVHPLD